MPKLSVKSTQTLLPSVSPGKREESLSSRGQSPRSPGSPVELEDSSRRSPSVVGRPQSPEGTIISLDGFIDAENYWTFEKSLDEAFATVITPDEGGSDAFVHISAVERADLPPLQEGQRVNYELQAGQNGKSSAENLTLAD